MREREKRSERKQYEVEGDVRGRGERVVHLRGAIEGKRRG